MFDNPLYGSMSSRGKEADGLPRKDHLSPPEAIFTFPKPPEGGGDSSDRMPPLPSPRNRSYTYSDTKPQPSSTTSTAPVSSGGGLQPQSYTKKPVVPSRSEGGVGMAARPPLPMKNQPAPPQIKPRDYRDSSELPSKLRGPSRPSPPIPKEGKGTPSRAA